MFFARRLIVAAVAFCLLLSAADAQANMRFIRDQETEDALHLFSRPIFQQAGLSPSAVRFILVEDDSLNAFVAGGQNIFIHTGLLLETTDIAELLGVIAHETGHIASGHLFRTQMAVDDITMQSMLINILGLAAAIGAGSGDAAGAAMTAGSTFAQRSFFKHSRVQESSADQSGVRYLKDAHLPLEGFLSFMGKLSSQELLPESQQSEYVRTHPLTRDRIDFLQNTVDGQRSKGQVPPEWIDIHARLRAKLYGYLFPERAINNTGADIASRYGRTIALYRRGRTAEALAETDKLIAAENKNPWFYELKGQILFENGNVSEAVAPYKNAVTYAPHSGLLRQAYAHALLESKGGDKALQEAVEQLKTSLRTEPYQARTHRLLATAYGRLGDKGMSHLHLAEEAYIRRNFSFARREIVLAQKTLPKNSPAWLRAEDIMAEIRKKDQKKN
jgi:predicted Zn-dependent protease